MMTKIINTSNNENNMNNLIREITMKYKNNTKSSIKLKQHYYGAP